MANTALLVTSLILTLFCFVFLMSFIVFAITSEEHRTIYVTLLIISAISFVSFLIATIVMKATDK